MCGALSIGGSQVMAQTRATSRSALVELFTSQGCSSCPPADALLGDLANQPNVIAIAFHVDYWDSLGWRDRFEIPQAVPRQTRYVSTLQLPSAFTPQAVVNGRISVVGSDKARILAAVLAPQDGPLIGLHIDNGDLVAELPKAATTAEWDVNFVAYLSRAATAVGHGENSGRTLEEFNIVRSFKRLGAWDGRAGSFRVSVKSLPPDADRVAMFLQQKNQGAVQSAVAIQLF